MAFQVIGRYKTFLFKAVWMDVRVAKSENIEMACALFRWQQAGNKQVLIGGVLFYLKI
jgi:hypothetical protein